jgi:hypothetical protein
MFMTEPPQGIRGVVHCDHHTLLLVDAGTAQVRPAVWHNGLVAGQRGAALITTGIHTGQVRVSAEVLQSPPGQADTDDWDDVAEVSMQALTSSLVLRGPTSASALNIPLPGPGHYRIRVHARGRDANIDGVAFEPTEDYRIILWPAPPGPAAQHKLTDRYGATVRRSAAALPRQDP